MFQKLQKEELRKVGECIFHSKKCFWGLGSPSHWLSYMDKFGMYYSSLGPLSLVLLLGDPVVYC